LTTVEGTIQTDCDCDGDASVNINPQESMLVPCTVQFPSCRETVGQAADKVARMLHNNQRNSTRGITISLEVSSRRITANSRRHEPPSRHKHRMRDGPEGWEGRDRNTGSE